MTYRQTLRELAADQRGYVTTRDAQAAGIPAVELRKLATRGALERVGRGVYRFADAQRSEDDLFVEAVLRVGPGAVLAEDAVLALHQLAHVAPKKIKVATANRVRLRDPSYIDVVPRRLAPDDVTTYRGIPSTTVARALRDCVGAVMPDRLLAAVSEATRRDLLTPSEAANVRRFVRKGLRMSDTVKTA